MKKLNMILLYCYLAIISYCFYGCGEDKIEELPLGTVDQNDDESPNNSSENETKEFSVKYVNGSENYLDKNGNLRISFTYRKEEKTLSFITESDWEINISDYYNTNKISDWLKITSEDDIEIKDNDNHYIITGKGRKEAYTIKFGTEENLEDRSFFVECNIHSINDNSRNYALFIVKSMPLVKKHDVFTGYYGGVYNHTSVSSTQLEYKINTNANWIKTNTSTIGLYNYIYYKIEPNETGHERKGKISISLKDYSGRINIDTLYITQSATKMEKQVNVSAAGTLSNQITTEEKYQITDLKVSGNLNGDDIRFLREMGGKDYANEETKGVLANLDLSEANIVSGGKPYSDYTNTNSTSNNTIGDYMFSGLNLVSVILPNSATNIEADAFSDCLSLKSVKLSQNLTPFNFSTSIFSGCISLETIEIPNSFTNILRSMFRGCTNLTEVKLSDNITNISSSAFSGCSKLPSITLPEKLETIERDAFSGCTSLKEITLPANVNTLGENVFVSCTNLTKIHCLNPEPPLCSGALGIEETATLYVPTASLEKYKDAAVWKNFKNIVGE